MAPWRHLYDVTAMVFGHYSDVIMSVMASQITSFTIVCSTVYSGADQRKHQSSASLAFVRGIHRWPMDSPYKGPVTRKMFPFDEVIVVGSGRDHPNPNGPSGFTGVTITPASSIVPWGTFVDSIWNKTAWTCLCKSKKAKLRLFTHECIGIICVEKVPYMWWI